jgi:hypothetical protein
MKKQQLVLLSIVLVLISATAAACAYVRSHRQLGLPGLKMLAREVYDTEGRVIGHETIDLPDKVLDYTASTNLPVTLEELGWLPKDTTYGRRIYQAPDHFTAFLGVVMMGVDSRSIHKPQVCLPGQGWRIDSSELLTIPMERPKRYDLPIMKLLASKEVQFKNGSRALIRTVFVYWFVADGQVTADHMDRMWRMGKGMVTSGTLQRWSYVTCKADCFPGQEEDAFRRLKDFIANSVPQFQIAPEPTTAMQTSSLQPQ